MVVILVILGDVDESLDILGLQILPERADVGPKIEHHELFPRRTNVHFVQVHSRGEVTMRTWERGSGITLACGTGASAVCAAGVLTDRTDRLITAQRTWPETRRVRWSIDVDPIEL